jgi:hypothetical protein
LRMSVACPSMWTVVGLSDAGLRRDGQIAYLHGLVNPAADRQGPPGGIVFWQNGRQVCHSPGSTDSPPSASRSTRSMTATGAKAAARQERTE